MGELLDELNALDDLLTEVSHRQREITRRLAVHDVRGFDDFENRKEWIKRTVVKLSDIVDRTLKEDKFDQETAKLVLDAINYLSFVYGLCDTEES